jgi:hypothetical protein
MRKPLLTLAFCLLIAFPAAASRLSLRGVNISVSTDEWEDITQCSQLHASFDGERVAFAEETLPAAGLSSLRIEAPRNGGIVVVGGSTAGYSVKACKAAASRDVSAIRSALRGNEVTTSGPEASAWVVYYLVAAPQNAVLDLRTTNGPLIVSKVVGSVTARAENGPVSVKQSSGTIHASAVNGPVSYSGNSGTVKLAAQNGPVSVKLSGRTFEGSLDGSTQNGPLSLKLPRDYDSGVVVESDGHGPVSCRAEACRNAKRSWDDDDSTRRIELGSGAKRVHLSSVNGPISVRESD